MSLLHKIPSVVSALALGYGVGMAAPAVTIDWGKAAVGGAPPAAHTLSAPAPPAEKTPPPPAPSAHRDGDESRALTRLREATRSERRGEACELDPPPFSRAPRAPSSSDGEMDDPADLDVASVSALSRLTLPDLQIPTTRRTLKYVRFFTRSDRGRTMFEAWLRRRGRYQEMIETELRAARLPEDLIWVAMIESGFDARVRSPAGAVGLWQFMPATGAVYGLTQSRFIDQRRSPLLATQAAAHHLRDLYLRFEAWELALAAYNMGYEQLLAAIDRAGTTDFNELSRRALIPRETAAYVPKIAAAALVANNLERFGFDRVDMGRPLDAAEIAVPPGTPLQIVARAAGVSTAAIRGLNPELLADRLPPGKGDFLVMVPAETMSRARAALPSLLDSEPLLSEDAAALSPLDPPAFRGLMKRRAQREDDSLLALLPPPKSRSSLLEPGGASGLDREPEDAPARPRRRARRERELLKDLGGNPL